jgi:hypothetical protein
VKRCPVAGDAILLLRRRSSVRFDSLRTRVPLLGSRHAELKEYLSGVPAHSVLTSLALDTPVTETIS